MQQSIIRPGLLVSLKTTIRGGVTYTKRELEGDHLEGKSAIARWETTRQIEDAAEHQLAVEARSKCRATVARVCCDSGFGLLCPEGLEQKLSAAVLEAQACADAFNKGAQRTRVEVYVLTGRIADTDEQAAKAIGSEVRGLLASMEAAIKAADPKAIRAAANEARKVSGMLSAGTATAVTRAIEEARTVARDIVRRVEKSGETAASVVEGLKLDALKAARFAVLDLDAGGAGDELDESGDAPAPVAAPAAARSIDLEPMEAAAAAPAPRRALELDGEV